MEVRLLKPEENVLFDAVMYVSFPGMEGKDIREMLKNPEEHKSEGRDKRWGYFDDKGKLLAGIIVTPFTIRMNGKDVKMAGIGGVATLPESRGLGCIRHIYEKAYPAMVEDGQVFSFLYPFSYDYYRKFGYEMCYANNKVWIPLSQLSKYPYPRNLAAHEPGDDHAPYAKIYAAFIKDYNLAVVRDAKAWEDLLKRDPYKDRKFTYLISNDAGEPVAYMLYTREEGEWGTGNLKMKEFCWANAEGFRLGLGFMGRMSAEYQKMCWESPDDVNVHLLIADCYDATHEVHCGGMNRIVSVLPALETLTTPCGTGSVAIEVTDDYYPANAGKYLIQWNEGDIKVARVEDVSADMAVSVQTLVQLVTGYITTAEAEYKNGTTIHGKRSELTALFPKRKLYLAERF